MVKESERAKSESKSVQDLWAGLRASERVQVSGAMSCSTHESFQMRQLL